MIFGDASFSVGLPDRRDRWHANATRPGRSLPKGLVASDLIVAESVTGIGSRGGGPAGAAPYEFFRDSCELEFVDSTTLDQALETHLRYDGELSVADCASVSIMSRRGITQIVSLDSEFDRIEGIERLSWSGPFLVIPAPAGAVVD